VSALFPEDSAERKTFPIYSGLLQYFPSALAAVANHSYNGNEKHNPGQELHHDRAKSGDEPDALVRHLMEGDLVGMAWRALAMLQKHLEAKGAPVAPGARNVPKTQWGDLRDYGVSITKQTFEEGQMQVKRVDPADVILTEPKAPAEPARMATAAEIEAYDQWQAKDAHGTTLLIGDTVRIVDPSHDDVLHGFGKGSFGTIAGRSTDTKMVLVQSLWKRNDRWFNSKQLEWVRP
jgi:hypothetical protein